MRAPLLLLLLFVSIGTVDAQQSKPTTVPSPSTTTLAAPSAADAAKISELLEFERSMEAAVVKGDVKYLATIIPADFRFTHGDGWTSGGQPIRVDTKETWLASVARQPYLNRDLGPVAVELHGDVAITYGRYKMHQRSSPTQETSVWFERVYAKQNGRWMYLSHRTVHGPLNEEPQKPASK